MAALQPEPDKLAVVFERDGEELIRTEAADGDKALLQAVTLLLAAKTLRPGDKLTVIARRMPPTNGDGIDPPPPITP